MTCLKQLYNLLRDRIAARRLRSSVRSSRIYGEIIMFHHVTDEYVDIQISCRCPIKVFEHYLDDYRKRGFSFVSMDEAYEIITNKSDHSPFCVVTFDDVPDNVFTHAYPILKQKEIPFAVFITTDYINNVNPRSHEKYVTTEHLKAWANDPLCTVGGHTKSHPQLKYCPDPKTEMSESKNILETIVGKPVKYIAYPYGKHSSVSKRIQKIAKSTGFKCALSTIEAPVTDRCGKSLYLLPRIPKF